MSILVNKDTKVIVQGFTGKEGTFHSEQCLSYGTKIVGGVTPGRGGQVHLEKPVFNTVNEAIKKTGANTSIIFVPPNSATDAIIEAANSNIKLAIVITEGIPVNDFAMAKKYAIQKGMDIIGPNCPGIITSEECKIGIMPGFIFKKGNVGLISKSGTLTYEASNQVVKEGFGISTAIGIGGDPIVGLGFKELLKMFQDDNDTKVIVLIGEIGGTLEIEAADFIRANITKPVVAFIAGDTAPKGKKMGHAGAIISEHSGTSKEKVLALESAGVVIAKTPAEIGKKVSEVFKNL